MLSWAAIVWTHVAFTRLGRVSKLSYNVVDMYQLVELSSFLMGRPYLQHSPSHCHSSHFFLNPLDLTSSQHHVIHHQYFNVSQAPCNT